MSIKPKYSQAILSGRKTVEFRKRPLASDIETVLIYESAPTMRVVGEFSIRESVAGDPASLWDQFADQGEIDREDYETYFANTQIGFVFCIKSTHKYETPVTLADIPGTPTAPQSFRYLDSMSILHAIPD